MRNRISGEATESTHLCSRRTPPSRPACFPASRARPRLSPCSCPRPALLGRPPRVPASPPPCHEREREQIRRVSVLHARDDIDQHRLRFRRALDGFSVEPLQGHAGRLDRLSRGPHGSLHLALPRRGARGAGLVAAHGEGARHLAGSLLDNLDGARRAEEGLYGGVGGPARVVALRAMARRREGGRTVNGERRGTLTDTSL